MFTASVPRWWSGKLLLLWLVIILPGLYILMAGGILGLPAVATSQWGGLPLSRFTSLSGALRWQHRQA